MMFNYNLQVKECYLVYLLQHFHNAEEKSVIIFTPTCRFGQYISCIVTVVKVVACSIVVLVQELSGFVPVVDSTGIPLCSSPFSAISGVYMLTKLGCLPYILECKQ